MFSVHGITGQVFRGTLEHLIQVPEVTRSRYARPIARDGEELGVEVGIADRYVRAAAEYTKMVHPEIERGPIRHAYQVMTQPVLTLKMTDTVESAWLALHGRGVRQAPVMDRTRVVVGMVCERDLLTVIDWDGTAVSGWRGHSVTDVMATPVVCAEPATDIRRIARVLLDTGLPALPVVDEGGELAGIVSRGDILRATVADPPLSLWA